MLHDRCSAQIFKYVSGFLYSLILIVCLYFLIDGDDDLTSSLGDSDMNIDRNAQKRRFSRLSDGYERLKSVLPSVKDKRRISKVHIHLV